MRKIILTVLSVFVIASCKQTDYSNYFSHAVQSLKSMKVFTSKEEGETDYGLIGSYRGLIKLGRVDAKVSLMASKEGSLTYFNTFTVPMNLSKQEMKTVLQHIVKLSFFQFEEDKENLMRILGHYVKQTQNGVTATSFNNFRVKEGDFALQLNTVQNSKNSFRFIVSFTAGASR
ncbi:MAG: hypothetical protein ACPGJV_12770 [Bacteriovoracaceae bacterium]